MRVIVASDNEAVSGSIRQLLQVRGYECSAASVVPLHQAVDRTVRQKPEVLVLVVPDNPTNAFGVLREVRSMTQARVLVVGPASDAQLILQVMREGAHQYLDRNQLVLELTSALQRLAADGAPRARRGHMISVLGPSGGCGSSTLAVNVATVLAKVHGQCGLFDLKLESGDLATLLDLDPAHSLADFCSNVSRMDMRMFDQCLANHPSGVRLLAAPDSIDDATQVTPQSVRKALSMARDVFSYVVVDMDHTYGDVQAQSLFQSNVILLVMRLEFAALRHVRRTLSYLKKLGITTDRVCLVVNRFRKSKELRISQVEDALGIRVKHTIPDDPRTVARANNKGVPFVLDRPSAAVSRSLVDVSSSVNGAYPS